MEIKYLHLHSIASFATEWRAFAFTTWGAYEWVGVPGVKDPWINQDSGFPIEERSGVVRWFVREAEQIVWGDSREELLERFPENQPKSATFIPAKLSDDPPTI